MGLLQGGIIFLFFLTFLPQYRQEEEGLVDVGSLLFGVADKPNSEDITNAEQQSLGTVNIKNTPGSDMVLTNNMKDMKERVDAAKRNISQLQAEMASYTSSSSQTTVSITDLDSEVQSLASSTTKVQEKMSALKTRLSSLKQTISTGSSMEETASEETDELMAANEQKMNDLQGLIPDLETQVEAALADLLKEESDLDELQRAVTLSAEVEERDEAQLVNSIEQTMAGLEATMDSMPGKMDTHCQILDKQVMLIQGTKVDKQGKKALVKYLFESAEASSTFEGGDASHVIDGSTEVFFYSNPPRCQATNYEWGPQPWLLLTLGTYINLGGVRVLVRGDCCYKLTDGLRVDTNTYNPIQYAAYYEFCTGTDGQLNAGDYTDLLCDVFRQAKYVKITATKHSQVSFCEVEALGVPLLSKTYGQPAMQSSSSSSETLAHLAVDNDYNTCSSTLPKQEGGDLWWQVDMGTTQYIGTVTLTFREGDNSDAARNIYVYLYNILPVTCDSTDGYPCGNTNDIANGNSNVFKLIFTKRSARYIRVVKQDAGSLDDLDLCEVEAM